MTSYLNLVRKSQYFDDVKGHRADTTARALRQKANFQTQLAMFVAY